MRGSDKFSWALSALEGDFSLLYAPIGRPSIPPEKLLRAIRLAWVATASAT
jgi:hypothetical protein